MRLRVVSLWSAVTTMRRSLHHHRRPHDTGLHRVDLARVGNNGPRFGLAVSVAVVGLAIGLVTLAVALTGGAPNALVHLYYVPILYAAARHGHVGALVAAIASGLATGPLMPSSHGSHGAQSFGEWAMRLGLMVFISLVASWLASQDPRPLDLLLRDVVLGRGLRSAVRNRRLRVHYQPLIDLTDGKVVGVEALCRWNDNRGRPVAPDLFIPAAEHTGAMMSVGREVLRQATEQSNTWVAEHGGGLTMSVNVSAMQLCKSEFLVDLTRVAGIAVASNYKLCIEITETAIIADRERALFALRAARAMGVLIAIDDFGTGQSSLAYLAGFPIDIIKIDQSFVARVDVDPTAHALLTAIVGIATSLGAVTIAEGIERPGQLDALRALGCDIGQGYYLGRPSEAASVDWTTRSFA